jgi:hypothetical protein
VLIGAADRAVELVGAPVEELVVGDQTLLIQLLQHLFKALPEQTPLGLIEARATAEATHIAIAVPVA